MKDPKRGVVACLLGVCLAGIGLPAGAENGTLRASITRTNSGSQKTFLQKHPVVKKTAIGAGVGTAAGAVTGLVTGKGGWRGAAIGAATGTSVALINSSKTMKQHPVAKKAATGGAVGLGLGLAANRGHGTAKRTAAATGIGTAVGLGVGLLKNEFE